MSVFLTGIKRIYLKKMKSGHPNKMRINQIDNVNSV